eukprot:Colp12_sorted_trinity150504_noHs@27675
MSDESDSVRLRRNLPKLALHNLPTPDQERRDTGIPASIHKLTALHDLVQQQIQTKPVRKLDSDEMLEESEKFCKKVNALEQEGRDLRHIASCNGLICKKNCKQQLDLLVDAAVRIYLFLKQKEDKYEQFSEEEFVTKSIVDDVLCQLLVIDPGFHG